MSMNKRSVDLLHGTLLDSTGYSCPACPSSDALKFYDNQPFCFSCNTGWVNYKGFPIESVPESVCKELRMEQIAKMSNYDSDGLPVSEELIPQKKKEKKTLELLTGGEFADLEQDETNPIFNRAISVDVCKKYNVRQQDNKDLILPYYDSDLNICAQKVRNEHSPKGYWRGDSRKAVLFGRHVYPTPGRRVYIVFGELDALALHEVTNEPVYSIVSGDGSTERNLHESFEHLNQWDQIVFVPDNDESSKKAAELGAQMFLSKSYIAKLDLKDPNEYLLEGRGRDLAMIAKGAAKYTPVEIRSFKAGWEAFMSDEEDSIAEYPFKELQDRMRGVRKGELTTVKAFPGVGKTTFLKELAYNIWKESPDCKIGFMFLESTERELISLMVSTHLNLPIKSMRESVSKEQLRESFNTFADSETLYYTNHFGGCASDKLIQLIEYLTTGLGCDVILLDHISMAIIGEDAKDERLALDSLGERLKTLTIEKDVNIHVVTHVNDDGSPRGSRILSQISNNVIALKRDHKSEDELVRNSTEVFLEKCRFTGDVGPSGVLYYDRDTGRLQDIPNHLHEQLDDKKGKK